MTSSISGSTLTTIVLTALAGSLKPRRLLTGLDLGQGLNVLSVHFHVPDLVLIVPRSS